MANRHNDVKCHIREHNGSQQIHVAEGDGLMMAPLAGIRFQKGVESRSICLQPYLEMIAIRKWQC